MAFHTDDISMNTIVGVGSLITGNVYSAGISRIDGDINGKLKATFSHRKVCIFIRKL